MQSKKRQKHFPVFFLVCDFNDFVFFRLMRKQLENGKIIPLWKTAITEQPTNTNQLQPTTTTSSSSLEKEKDS